MHVTIVKLLLTQVLHDRFAFNVVLDAVRAGVFAVALDLHRKQRTPVLVCGPSKRR